ncbi:O-linked N-acetylglucosamine transferase, SPINDLY family protein [Chroococcidiopsis sp. CCNUC1]|uniref:O-linked N-acetylglucosamine transferase, SPINDLY family protein n=1 Tax=Chroococcidiopsis sp. CCNUC1 TaxID=2653189 RepID=UPI00202196B9|nr:O-linked N-acetylglucosamine transferase, SPINDLY family protein [Chroococcidiopsis sp. CCNUC1]URD52688.1 O-linked N-acetylglucosamine transferase, SPINDLY family protein [Chroococcidiopsis sp. CCNUC1]
MVVALNLQVQTSNLLTQGKYSQLASLYERAIETEPEVISHYWHLGLAYLLQEQEEVAQTTWLLAMSEASNEEAEQWTKELIQILDTEAQRQLELENLQLSWLIRQHIREITPTNIDNILQIIQLGLDLDSITSQDIAGWQVNTLIQQASPTEIDLNILLETLIKFVAYPIPASLSFAESCLPHYTDRPAAFIDTVMPIAVKIAHQLDRPDFATDLAQLCLRLNSEHPEALRHLSCFHSKTGCHQEAIKTAKHFFQNCQSPYWQIQGSYILLRAILSAGSWLDLENIVQRHKALIPKLLQDSDDSLNIDSHILTANFFLPYIEDRPQENRPLQNQIAQIFQTNFQAKSSPVVQTGWTNSITTTKKLKIGYVAHTLKGHSVGWLSRWLFQYYDREAFQTNLYLIYQQAEGYQWFEKQVDCVHTFGVEPQKTATQIKADEIDILVDLDSLTLDTTCQVMALKPAPVQVTWLGWDASGLPAVDYYIADPYVLPENAQNYYSEKIWRLPQTYIAVDGFEVGVPTLRREHLEIPSDAVVYLSSQTGYKRHPDTVRLQMKILSQVPNSYFLVKGRADENMIREFFNKIAEDEGVNPDRLRFLSRDPSEFAHRANLEIADIVLDTYPYNGATTTLETLWMGIPLVTKVGQQFAARNSYTFMMNVGVTEGIAWTDEEYVEWGVRLGKDASLRQQISWKLRQSRQTSPLWNAKQFTLEMEKAYKQMWQRYVEVNFV